MGEMRVDTHNTLAYLGHLFLYFLPSGHGTCEYPTPHLVLKFTVEFMEIEENIFRVVFYPSCTFAYDEEQVRNK